MADDSLRPPQLITYDMRGNLSRTIDILNGWPFERSDTASDDDNRWTDPASLDAHVYLGWTYDFLFKQFGRRGLDDNNGMIRAITHPVRRADVFWHSSNVIGTFYTNAFWCQECGPGEQGVMVFGEGLPIGVTFYGRTWNYLAGGLDVIAHELTHGVTSRTSRLEGGGEPGALDESFSDIIGTSVEFNYHAVGTGSQRADYLIGEDITPGGIRSMSNPQLFGHPDHYSRRGVGSRAEVHMNAGIPNNAFYLAVEGGVNRTSGLRVTGVGTANRYQIEKAFYRAFTSMLTSRATFSMARRATVQSARELYGPSSSAERAIAEAWTAVGVN
jgi:bacillolysin